MNQSRAGADQTLSKSILGALVVLATCYSLNDARLWRRTQTPQGDRVSSQPVVFAAWDNNQIGEAQAWWEGRLDLGQHPDRRRIDTAVRDGKVYSHFPPLFTILAFPFVLFYGGVPHWMVVLIVIPIPILAYLLFHRVTGSPWGATLLAIGLVCGTSLWPAAVRTIKGGGPYLMNHVLATIGLLILLVALAGRRRFLLAVLGLIIAEFSRQLTTAYLLPLFHAAMVEVPERRPRAVATALIGAIVMLGVPAALNTLKFGNPLDTGYMRIYEGRDDRYATDAREHGVFSTHFIPRNLYYLNLGFPKAVPYKTEGRERWTLKHQTFGVGIWWTTPLLLWLFADFCSILCDRSKRIWLVAVGLIFLALLCFHATGSDQRGYNRFSLDFVPVIFYLIAPHCLDGRRKWVSVVMVAWSVVYFRWLI